MLFEITVHLDQIGLIEKDLFFHQVEFLDELIVFDKLLYLGAMRASVAVKKDIFLSETEAYHCYKTSKYSYHILHHEPQLLYKV